MDGSARPETDLLPIFCFSHLRWHSVFQRPQHIMSRFAKNRSVFFIEEPERGTVSDCARWSAPRPA
jgi:UDP-galactopyranose mutase